MDKIEKIRAEVERYIKHYKKLERNDFRDGELYICYELLFFIDSLRQEQSEADLERDAVQFCFDKGLNITPYQAKTIARHFYELGKNSK